MFGPIHPHFAGKRKRKRTDWSRPLPPPFQRQSEPDLYFIAMDENGDPAGLNDIAFYAACPFSLPSCRQQPAKSIIVAALLAHTFMHVIWDQNLHFAGIRNCPSAPTGQSMVMT